MIKICMCPDSLNTYLLLYSRARYEINIFILISLLFCKFLYLVLQYSSCFFFWFRFIRLLFEIRYYHISLLPRCIPKYFITFLCSIVLPFRNTAGTVCSLNAQVTCLNFNEIIWILFLRNKDQVSTIFVLSLITRNDLDFFLYNVVK